jgi:ribosomal protein S18 acetylase RimI-like enzyme
MAELRLMTTDDGDWAQAQMARERWSSYAGWLRAHLGHDPEGCFVAEVNGQRAGMVTTTAFARTGWIGNLIVEPHFRRQGLGTLLMRRALEQLRGAGLATLRLDADPPGIGIYRRLGFRGCYDSLRFWARKLRGRPHAGVRTAGDEDLERMCAFDAPRFGDDRGRFLGLLRTISDWTFVIEKENELHGFTFVIPTQDGAQIGPTVATGAGAARALLETAAHAAAAPALVTGIAAVNHTGVELLRDLGFHESGASHRMVWGDPDGVTDDPHSLFAIASGACG